MRIATELIDVVKLMEQGFRDRRRGRAGPRRRTLGAAEIAGIVLLSVVLHLGLWWLYQHWTPERSATMQATDSGAGSVEVTLVAPSSAKKRNDPENEASDAAQDEAEKKSRNEAKSQPEQTHTPPHKTQTKPKPKSKPKPEPKPKPESKPETKPKPKSKSKPKPEQPPKAESASESASSPAKHESAAGQETQQPSSKSNSKQITPAVSGLRLLNNKPPQYPRRALRRHEEGTVKLKILVKADGSAGKVTVAKSSGYGALDDAAVAAVKKWQFKPARRGDTPIPGYALQTITFKVPD